MNKLLLTATLLFATATAQAATDPALDKVLRDLDASSPRFQSAEVDFKWDFFERVVQDTTHQVGSLYIRRVNSQPELGAIVKTEDGKTVLKVIGFHGNSLDIYDAGTKQTQHVDATANRSAFESFLTLGFGGSGRDLERVWNITLQGTEQIDGVQTAKLDLVSKDPNFTKNTFSHITLWVDPARGISLKQIFYTPNRDTRTNYYTNVRYNAKINAGKYALPKK